MKHALMAIFAVAFAAGCSEGQPEPAKTPTDSHAHERKVDGDKVTDVVCGMTVDKGTLKVEHANADYYFCAQTCVDKFKANTAKYAKACTCKGNMDGCACDHCAGKRVPCDCGS